MWTELANVIDTDVLDAATQTLFRRLGVFVGGWTVEAAEAVTALNVQTFSMGWQCCSTTACCSNIQPARTRSRALRCWRRCASMLYQESLDIYRQLNDRVSLAWLYNSWSDMAVQQGEDAHGLALSQEGLRLFRELDAKWGMRLALHLQGILRQRQGDDTRALACLAECLALFVVSRPALLLG